MFVSKYQKAEKSYKSLYMRTDKRSEPMLFKKAANEMAYLKAGVMGFAGSGKTFSASKIAIGLHKYIKASKPVFFLDTETGSDFMIERFKEAKIELMTAKTRAFSDLIDSVNEAERSGSILIIDSISHFWTELIDAFQRKNNVKRLQFQHWGIIKPEWRQFTDRYLTSKLHIIMCGRAGWEYEYEKDDEGVKELIKTGTKMNAEKEMGYEPSLLLEMEKYKADDASKKIGGAFKHRCWVLKDRFDAINGHFFDNPIFENFLPHISKLNLGGEHNPLDTSRTSEDMIASTKSQYEWTKQRDIALEEIKNEITLKISGKSAEDQKAKIELLRNIFKTSSWTEIENKKIEDLKDGLDKLKKYVIKESK